MAVGRRRKDQNRSGRRYISLILFVFIIAMSFQIARVYQKDQEYAKKQEQLEQQLEAETVRQQELEAYESYTRSQQYIEDIARSKLGLAYEDEIIFKEVNNAGQ